MKWIIIDQDSITTPIRGGNIESNLSNGQAVLRVNEENESYLVSYKKYSAQEIMELNLESVIKFESFSPRAYKNQPFKDKFYEDGSKLYERIHGTMDMIAGDTTSTIRIQVPYLRCFFTEAEIINSFPCSTVDFSFQVKVGEDTYVDVFQHGFSVNMGEGTYKRKSDYEAELTNTLYIAATITNKDPNPRCYGLNIILHEAV